MEIKIIRQQYNPLLKRKEIVFEVDHSQTKSTPSRLDIRRTLAEAVKANLELVYVKRVTTKAGTMIALGEATAYDSPEQAKLVEAKYIIARNTPKEKKESAEKPEPPKAPEKAEQPKPAGKAEQPAKKE